MGIQLKTVSVKWDPETTRMSDELQASFAPFVEGRSQLTRLAIKKLHIDVMAQGTLAVIGECLQGFHEVSSSPQPVIEFPAHPSVPERDSEFESLLANATLQPAKVPSSFFPRMAFKAGVVQ